ncbi:MAG: tyrosine-type recombinase/integrase [Christensenellaceae bacterium]|nr:tyrosine-type recombinase/integrase [Christensenellaceae bacterium]
MAERTYFEQRNLDNLMKIRNIQKELPVWFTDFLRSVENTTSVLTRLNYAYDTRVFLKYLTSEHISFAGTPLYEIKASSLDELKLSDLERYVDYLSFYITRDEIEHENSERGKARKIASLRTLFKYLYKNELIKDDPAQLLAMPKLHDKVIIRLDPAEVSELIRVIESGDGLTEKQLAYHRKTVKRDLAIIVIFLTTGMRVSELVGLNISDIDLKNMCLKITRKGGNQSILYFDYETLHVIEDYLEERELQETMHLPPLFLSMQNKRIGVQAVANLVKKYAKIAAPLKKITPHKLRSTYGTMLYQGTGDIYLVADVLGHKDVNTTRKHYAAMSEESRRMAAKVVKLRE